MANVGTSNYHHWANEIIYCRCRNSAAVRL